ncbi:MAG: c-type cytochrome [Mucilaginibacter sp.]|nr:c-type cytochrome [Mucilaginibacter sp.]
MRIKINRKFAVVVTLVASVTGTAAMAINKPEPVHYENLKVLPKDISPHDLQSIMADDFEDGLGVTCGFCHANAKDGHGLDFVSDAKPEKEITRQMMRMTIGINKKYFKLKHPKIGNAALVVSCTTCHKGQAFPDAAAGNN